MKEELKKKQKIQSIASQLSKSNGGVAKVMNEVGNDFKEKLSKLKTRAEKALRK